VNEKHSVTRLFALGAVALLVGILAVPPAAPRALAFQVEPLPADNLVKNPWFRSAADPTASGLDGWTDAGSRDRYWSTSQKESNPSPDSIAAADCGSKPVFCGTAARLSTTPGQSGGVAVPGRDAYLWQVVAADPQRRTLRFSTHWVSHLIDPAEVTIYGGGTPGGPWVPVWVPFHHVQNEVGLPPGGEQQELWEHTGLLQTTLAQGYPFYRIEIHARLPQDGTVGFKATGLYLTAIPQAVPSPTPTNRPRDPQRDPTPTASSTPKATSTAKATATPTPTPKATATRSANREPAATSTPLPTPSPTPTPVPTGRTRDFTAS
jgi:hypothetical protein